LQEFVCDQFFFFSGVITQVLKTSTKEACNTISCVIIERIFKNRMKLWKVFLKSCGGKKGKLFHDETQRTNWNGYMTG